MSWKGAIFLALIALGVPFFIFYNIFFQEAAPLPPAAMPGFAEYQSRILALTPRGYEVLSVVDEQFVLRVNVRLEDPLADRTGIRMQATNVLYDLQAALGKDLSVAVWAYRSGVAQKADLLGMLFYHQLTEKQVFKSPDELQ